MMDLSEIAAATKGDMHHGNPIVSGVSTDTRTVAQNELFVALRGERFDGHDYLDSAIAGGAAAAVVDRVWAEEHALALPHVVVEDTRLSLGHLAAHWREKFALPLIGITGSNGKTTVKEMVAAILRAQALADGHEPDLAVLATEGNFNNDIGLPLTLLRLGSKHRCAVVEMGMNHPGEIGYLTRIAQPTVAVITNAQRAHLEGVSNVSTVAQEKAAIYAGLGASGVAVVNADDPFCEYWRGLNAGRQILSFGLDLPADVTAQFTLMGLTSALKIQTPEGSADVLLQAPGLHNVRNALAATAVVLGAGAPLSAVADGLGAYTGVKGRLQLRLAKQGASLIDDTYNANPDSVRAAIDVLAFTPGRKILVLGDMGEIGDQAAQFHDEVGGYAKSAGVDLLFAIGSHSELAARNFGGGARHFLTVEDLVPALTAELAAGTTVLVKGSRFMHMERVADAISEQ